jgi:hypothetical protein
MTRLIRLVFVFGFLLFASSFAVPQVGTKSDVSNLLTQFLGYHLLTLEELNPETRTFFAGHFPKQNPSLVRCDVDGDGNLDYAMMLKIPTEIALRRHSRQSDSKSHISRRPR